MHHTSKGNTESTEASPLEMGTGETKYNPTQQLSLWLYQSSSPTSCQQAFCLPWITTTALPSEKNKPNVDLTYESSL